jgi:hypothetical protein
LLLCEIARIARSAYYKWLRRTPSENEKWNEEIMEKIKCLFEKVDGIYGYGFEINENDELTTLIEINNVGDVVILSNGVKCLIVDIQSNPLHEIINEIKNLANEDGSDTRLVENGWRINDFLISNIHLSHEIKGEINEISRIIVSAHLNNDNLQNAINWVNEISKFGYKLNHIKSKLLEIMKLQNGLYISDIRDNRTLNSIGLLYRELKTYPKAKTIYLRALELDPRNILSLTQFGALCRKAGWYDEGISYFEQAINIKKAKHTYNGLGGLFRDMGELDKAIEVYNSSLKLDNEDNCAAHTGIGAVYFDK